MKRDNGGKIVIEVEIDINKEIRRSSNLRSIIIIFLRHQHILRVLIIISIFIRLIIEFSTSKVDIFINY